MEQVQQKQVVKALPPYASTKFFLSSLNTFLGNNLVQRLRNDHVHPQNPNRIVGTLTNKQPQMTVPEGVRKVIDTQKVTFFEEVILNSDVIIYDLNTCDLKEIQFVISTLKIKPFDREKILICVSNIMTWAKSRPKQKKQGEEEQGDDNPPEEPDSEEEGEQPPDAQEQKKTYVRFTDRDYSLRKPAHQYEKIKSIETLCLAAGNVKKNLKTYVVCSGLLYGCGQRLFAPYFRQAILQQPEALPYFQKGKNRIPLVHIKDLVTYIEKIIEKKPNQPYLLALDHNPKPSLKRIMEAISKGIGTGKIISTKADPSIQNIDMLTVNLRMKPTMCFAKIQEQQAAVEQQQGNQVPKFKFVWQSKDGLQKNIQKLSHEFNQARSFYQQKVLITGPPGSGKTHFAARMAEKYYLPHIHIKGVIQEVKGLQNQLGQEIRNFLTQRKDALVGEKQAEFDQLKEKWKKIPKDLRQPLQPYDPEKVDARLSEELVYKCFQWRLSQNDCLNRGYILDAYPRKYQDAMQIFYHIPPSEDGEEANQENQKKVLNQRIAPKKAVFLQMPDGQIINRLRTLPEQQILGTHFTEKQTKRRIKLYRQTNDESTGDLVLKDFFKENKIAIFNVNVSSQTEGILQSIISPQTMEQKAEADAVDGKVRSQHLEKQKRRDETDKRQKVTRDIQNEDYVMKKQNQQNEEKQILDKKSLALRKYLDVNLVPILSEGIVEVLENCPNDPVDYLAQFLFKNSLKVPNPDPSTFQF